jgi:hypothetical protein
MNNNEAKTPWKQKIIKNRNKLLLWNLLWVLSTATLAFAPKYLWDFNTSLTLLSVVLNLLMGLGVVLANRAHFRNLDEMQQKIQGDSMALTLSVGLVVAVCYELFEDIKLITFEPEISHLVIIMCLTYLIGNIIGTAKYK